MPAVIIISQKRKPGTAGRRIRRQAPGTLGRPYEMMSVVLYKGYFLRMRGAGVRDVQPLRYGSRTCETDSGFHSVEMSEPLKGAGIRLDYSTWSIRSVWLAEHLVVAGACC